MKRRNFKCNVGRRQEAAREREATRAKRSNEDQVKLITSRAPNAKNGKEYKRLTEGK